MVEENVYDELWNHSLKYPHELSVSIISEKKGIGFRRRFGPFKEDLSDIDFKKIVYKRIKERIRNYRRNIQVLSTLLRIDVSSKA